MRKLLGAAAIALFTVLPAASALADEYYDDDLDILRYQPWSRLDAMNGFGVGYPADFGFGACGAGRNCSYPRGPRWSHRLPEPGYMVKLRSPTYRETITVRENVVRALY